MEEHYPSEVGFGVFPQVDSTIAIVIVDSRYSPNNYWNGRWRSWYLLEPSSGRISGSIEIDVHYFEDGNVRLKTLKEVGIIDATEPLLVINKIANAETKYQEDVNHAFIGLNEGSFKALRRQLPVTRSKMNWGKSIGNYRLGKGKYFKNYKGDLNETNKLESRYWRSQLVFINLPIVTELTLEIYLPVHQLETRNKKQQNEIKLA